MSALFYNIASCGQGAKKDGTVLYWIPYKVPLVRNISLSRWPNEWTEKVDSSKKNIRDGWKEHARMMNCIKMLGLGITKENCLLVRDHRSRGCPHAFWRYNNKCKLVEDVH